MPAVAAAAQIAAAVQIAVSAAVPAAVLCCTVSLAVPAAVVPMGGHVYVLCLQPCLLQCLVVVEDQLKAERTIWESLGGSGGRALWGEHGARHVGWVVRMRG